MSDREDAFNEAIKEIENRIESTWIPEQASALNDLAIKLEEMRDER